MHFMLQARRPVRVSGGRQVKVRPPLPREQSTSSSARQWPTSNNFTVSSFDPASLAILQRLDELESLVRVAIPDTTTPQEVDHPSSGKAFQAQEGFSQRDSLSSQEPFINVEAVLEWPILRSFLDTQPLSLANILQAGSAETDVAWNRLLQAPDFDEDATNQLLQNFIDNFHIYNPVIELTHLQEDIRTSLYNGLGWDSSACISVRSAINCQNGKGADVLNQ